MKEHMGKELLVTTFLYAIKICPHPASRAGASYFNAESTAIKRAVATRSAMK
jgi:hypothetical protein